MLRSRWFRALVLLVCMAGMLYIVASLYLPSSQKLIVGVNKRTGAVRVVGAHVAFLPPHEYYRLSFDRRNGYAQRDGFIRTLSQDQVPVMVAYRLRFSIAPGQRLPDARALVSEGWRAWLDHRVAEAVDTVTRHVSVEELLAPTSQFNAQRDPLRRVVTAYLARSGLNVTAFEVARMEADREALLRANRAGLRTRPVDTNVAPKQFQAGLQAAGQLRDFSRNDVPVIEQADQQTAAAKPLPPEAWGSYAYYNNLGISLRKQGKLKEAIDAFNQAIRINPHSPTPCLNLSMAFMDRRQYTAADEAFMQAVANGLPRTERWIVDYAALYRERDMPSRAITLLAKGKEMFPQSYEIAANLGSALAASGNYAGGLAELERALGLQPSSTLTLNNIGIFYAKKNDYARALDFWNRSLAIDPHQPEIRAAAEAAKSRL